jgi:hypothetical protein
VLGCELVHQASPGNIICFGFNPIGKCMGEKLKYKPELVQVKKLLQGEV